MGEKCNPQMNDKMIRLEIYQIAKPCPKHVKFTNN